MGLLMLLFKSCEWGSIFFFSLFGFLLISRVKEVCHLSSGFKSLTLPLVHSRTKSLKDIPPPLYKECCLPPPKNIHPLLTMKSRSLLLVIPCYFHFFFMVFYPRIFVRLPLQPSKKKKKVIYKKNFLKNKTIKSQRQIERDKLWRSSKRIKMDITNVKMCVACLLCSSSMCFSVFLFFLSCVCFVGPLHVGSAAAAVVFYIPPSENMFNGHQKSYIRKAAPKKQNKKKTTLLHIPSLLKNKGLYQHNCSSSFIDTFLSFSFPFHIFSRLPTKGKKIKN